MNPIGTSTSISESAKSGPSTSKPESSSEPTPLQSEEDSTDLRAHKLTKHRRENAKDKSKRLLVSGRLRVLMVNGSLIAAECRGDSGEVYKVDYGMSREGLWTCNCPAHGPCSHLHALWAVTAVER